MIYGWLRGLLARRPARLVGAVLGVATTITLLSSLGIFLSTSSRTMTARAVSTVPVDWQVQLASGADEGLVREAIVRTSSFGLMETVGYAEVAGFRAATGGTVQTTGPGLVLGISPHYRRSFSHVIRQLTGGAIGVLVAQQTAANLHVKPGDTLTIERMGGSPVSVKVDGVIDLPSADSLFQAIGAVPGLAPQAPPDNVLLLPDQEWHTVFDPQTAKLPDGVHLQFHVKLTHGSLPASPTAAHTYVTRLANNLEARLAGQGIVGNNLGAKLAAVRSDAVYARVLFLFLGLPGAILATLLTLAIAATGKEHLQREQALLRVRGASTAKVLIFESMEALIIGGGGIILGAGLSFAAGWLLTSTGIHQSRISMLWVAAACVIGLFLAALAVILPAWRQARQSTIASARAVIRTSVEPPWKRLYLDLILLGLSLYAYWQTAQTGYQVVLAPEGISQISVHYEAFIAPLCLWLGGVLLGLRTWENGILRDRTILRTFLRPIAGNLSAVVSSSLVRQRRLISRGVVLVALAIAFALSTAVFNTTFNAQSRVDAELSNGADVTVTGSTEAPLGGKLAEIRAMRGVAAAQPMIHRFAYVGNDLQDIYGIDSAQIGKVTRIVDAYFARGNAKDSLAMLAAHADGVLVSEETRQNFQLQPGDRLNLRLQFPSDHQYHEVPFEFLGVVREFPTAPKDSFLVANASYLAQETGSGAQEILLVRARTDPSLLAKQIREVVSSLPGARVADIGSAQKAIGSTLTSIDLNGLTRFELAFAVILVMGATGLILGLGMSERRRNFAILNALGAKSRQLGAFIWSEGLLVLVGGAAIGTLLGLGVAVILVRVLSGVFDPPPEHLVIPWGYAATMVTAAVVATTIAVSTMKLLSQRPVVEELQRL